MPTLRPTATCGHAAPRSARRTAMCGRASLPIRREQHAGAQSDAIALGHPPVGDETANRLVAVDDAERAFERGRRRAQSAHALLEHALQLHLAHAGPQRFDGGSERVLGDGDRGTDALDLGRALHPARRRASRPRRRRARAFGNVAVNSCSNSGVRPSTPIRCAPETPGMPATAPMMFGGVPAHRVQALGRDLGGHAEVGDAQQVDGSGLAHDDAARRERARPGEPEARRLGHEPGVAFAPEHEHVDVPPRHLVERGERAPQPRGPRRASLSRSYPSSVTATISSARKPALAVVPDRPARTPAPCPARARARRRTRRRGRCRRAASRRCRADAVGEVEVREPRPTPVVRRRRRATRSPAVAPGSRTSSDAVDDLAPARALVALACVGAPPTTHVRPKSDA